MPFLFEYLDDDGYEQEHSFPSKKEVCPRCNGEGKHVNPNVDGHGITAEEWEQDWDDESREMYFSGGYDVMCEECHGHNVVDVPDESRFSSQDKKVWEIYLRVQKDLHDLAREERAERLMGC